MNGYDDLSIDRLFRLDGDVAFVTGGGDGFGRIASMAYANAGASVAVLFTTDGSEHPLTGLSIYFMRSTTKKNLSEETFQVIFLFKTQFNGNS